MPQQKLIIVPVTLHTESENTKIPLHQIQLCLPQILIAQSKKPTLEFPSSTAFLE